LQHQTDSLVQQYADDLLQNRTAWDKLTAQAAQLQVQTLTCETIVHKPIFVPGKFDPGGCEPATLQPGTPPSFTKGTPGTWTPGRAKYFTPGFWCGCWWCHQLCSCEGAVLTYTPAP
jgi:hypothetical protein